MLAYLVGNVTFGVLGRRIWLSNDVCVGNGLITSVNDSKKPYRETQKAHQGLFVFLVEPAGIEPASASRPKTVLHT